MLNFKFKTTNIQVKRNFSEMHKKIKYYTLFFLIKIFGNCFFNRINANTKLNVNMKPEYYHKLSRGHLNNYISGVEEFGKLFYDQFHR